MQVDIDLGRAFGFVFDDEQWVSKILIGGLIILIPILGMFWLMGYMMDVGERVANNAPKPLPDIDFGSQLGKGFASFVISLVYALPVIVLVCVVMLLFVPLAGAAEGSQGGDAAIVSAMLGLWFCLFPLLFVAGLVIQVFVFASYVLYIQTGNIGQALNVGRAWQMLRAAPTSWLILFLVYILASLVASAGAVAFGIGALFTTAFSQAMFGHALGQVAAQMRGGAEMSPARL